MGILSYLRRKWDGRRKNWVTVSSVNDLKGLMPDSRIRLLDASTLKSITPADVLSRFQANNPVWKDWSTERAVEEGYKISVWVYACVFRNARSAAGVPWRGEQKVAGEWQPMKEEHPAVKLIENPNPYWSRQDLMERLAMHLNLGGEGYMPKIRSKGKPVELWLIGPDKVRPVPDAKKYLSHYEVTRNGRPDQTIKPENLVHFMFTDPANPYRGIGPLQAGAKAVDSDNEAIDWQKTSLENRAVMDGVLTSKEPLSDDQFDVALARFREQHKGADKNRGPLILSGDWGWSNFSFNPVEMDFVKSRAFSRVEICSAFGVPPPVIGILDDATLANISTSWLIYWLGTVLPYLEDIRDTLNLGLASEWGDDDFRLNFDISKVAALRELFRQDVDTGTKLWMMGVPFNRVNQRLNLGFSEFEGWDKSYIPVNMIPAENAGLIGTNIGQVGVEEAAKVLRNRAEHLLNGNGRIVLDAIDQLALQLTDE